MERNKSVMSAGIKVSGRGERKLAGIFYPD
jgi:hypothetical protein